MPMLLSHDMTATSGLDVLIARDAGSVDETQFESRINLAAQLNACRLHVEWECTPQLAPYPPFAFFFSVTDGEQRAHVIHVRGSTFEETWALGVVQMQDWAASNPLARPWLRVDWVEGARAVSWERLLEQLALTQRNYFRTGLALDSEFDVAFTEQEINANAMLYAGGSIGHATVNRHNFETYTRLRFGEGISLQLPPAGSVYLLSMRGVFCQDDGVAHLLAGSGLDAGRRTMELTPENLLTLVRSGSDFLAQQVKPSGLFVYGRFPSFDRAILTYNTLRHASSLYAMLQAYELTRDAALLEAIEVSLRHLTGVLIRRQTLPDGQAVAFLLDGDEIKLGGNAMCLLVLVKYCELTNTRHWMPLLDELAAGIAWMQDLETGQFNHVMNAIDLSLRQAARIIYYDGEAVFGLLRLYALTGNVRWLAVAEKAFDYFIVKEHWQANDHWLGYCANEMTRWRPLEKYFRFGIKNVAEHLDFVLERKTTFPTLLELMVATQEMIERLALLPRLQHLLGELDLEKFDKALKHRAQYLLNGFFWPEYAMYFRRPVSIVGSFFIRHHAFRVRIDDVEHYLSGLIGYRRMLLARVKTPAMDTPLASLP
jgi:hypothetical protein